VQELASISNGERLTPPTLETFQPRRYVIHVNILWFLSLCLSLGCGLGATLVQQWLRRYIRLTQYSDAPVCRVRIRTFLFNGIQDFHVSWIVENTSITLHAAIFLFFAGLVEFLFAINDEVADAILVIVIVFGALYIIVTFLPVIFRQCPFQTPLTSFFWYTGHILAISFLYPFTCSNHVRARINELQSHFCKGVDRHLMGMMKCKPELDKDALESTLSMCHDENELEAFVDAIPSYLRMAHDIGSRIDDLESLLKTKGKESPLHRRLALLFTSCVNNDRRMDEGERRRRAIICCRAIWEISRAALSAKTKDVTMVLPMSIDDTLQRLTMDSDSAIAASALRTMAIFKRALLEQQPDPEVTKVTRQSTDTIATPTEDVGGMKDPLSLPYQAGPRNEKRSNERLNTVTEFTSKILTLIPHLGKPSYMDLEETKMTLEELCQGLNGRDFSHADQQRLVDILGEALRIHAQLASGNAVSTGTLCH